MDPGPLAKRAHLDEVLRSRCLAAAPKLRQLLQTLATAAIDGVDVPKEYALGVDLFGRPADYDPKTDSIVRVSINRLRLKLLEYYKSEGSNTSLRIEIPKGSYVPQFSTPGAAGATESDTQPSAVPAPEPVLETVARRSFLTATAVNAAIAAGGAALGFASWEAFRKPSSKNVEFRRLTHRRGELDSARYHLGGRQAVFSGRFDLGPPRMFLHNLQRPEPQLLSLPPARLAGLTDRGEALILLDRGADPPDLARTPLTGGNPRRLEQGIGGADWDRTGEHIGIIRAGDGMIQVEFPIGKRITQMATDTSIRVSSTGECIAIRGFAGTVGLGILVARQGGAPQIIAKDLRSAGIPAWHPSRFSIVYCASTLEDGDQFALYEQDARGGKPRELLSVPELLDVYDLSPSGELIGAFETANASIQWTTPKQVRDVTWFGASFLGGVSADGAKIVFSETRRGVPGGRPVYWMGINDATPTQAGHARYADISPDGRWVALASMEPSRLHLIPTEEGTARELPSHGLVYRYVGFSPDSANVVFAAMNKENQSATYIQSITGGPPRRISPFGFNGRRISPDGRWLMTGNSGCFYLIDLQEPIPSPRKVREATRDQFNGWHADSRRIYCSEVAFDRRSIAFSLFDVFTRRREIFKRINVEDSVGTELMDETAVTPDGSGLLITRRTKNSSLVRIRSAALL